MSGLLYKWLEGCEVRPTMNPTTPLYIVQLFTSCAVLPALPSFGILTYFKRDQSRF